ncbi:MAG: SRPBCC domain-containing protein [Pyrinomonadaceae bacterium]|nr:SRPBCC domain-containing protein [Pyrinomonadaceae bacterium]MBP6212276.1 SRPBCC domain-containing protein [Pyrinomonadaceae bacterium]
MNDSITKNPDAAICIERTLSAGPREIFAAFEDPERLARWWGPAGFTNTFERCEFEPGGHWVYVMHGPDGRDYPNECVFREIEPETRIVIEHVVLPLYTLTITLENRGDKTHLTWRQEFENDVFATKMHDFLTTANNENLDRLEAVLAETVA